jgi:glycosyltransferase involved in cell wall biosynthesis
MYILMIAPEPIFEPRGTPMSVVGRLKALSEMGHQVDLVTYPIGQNVYMPRLRIIRTIGIPGIKKVKIGPSFAKLPLDLLLIIQTIRCLLRKRYDLIHAHEEAGFWCIVLARLFRIPYLYDMHSSLPQQLTNFQFSRSRILTSVFDQLEHWVLKYANSVITICPDLFNHVTRIFPEKDPFLIENVVDYGMIFGESDQVDFIRKKYPLNGRRIALYTGTFEPYQGLDLLIDAAGYALQENPSLVFLLVGGHPDQVDYYMNKAYKNGVSDAFIFTGQVQPQEINSYIRCADILLSPRTAGTNTPLKIYAYLRSGLPVVATRLLTHTQVLDDSVAILTEPKPKAFSEGIAAACTNHKRVKRIIRKSKKLAEEKYSYSVYQEKFGRALKKALEGRP